MTSLVENTVFEQLFLGLHHLSALEKIKGIRPGADVARIGVLAWYYGIANGAVTVTGWCQLRVASSFLL